MDPIVLCFGAPQARDALASSLLSYASIVAPSPGAAEPTLSASSLAMHASKSVELSECPYCIQEYSWVLDTKYYTAHLKLWVVPGDARASLGEDPALRAALTSACASGRVQGLLLACSPKDNLEVLAQWADLLQSLRSTQKAGAAATEVDGSGDGESDDGFSLQLLVAVSPENNDGSTTSDSKSSSSGDSVFATDESRVAAVEWGLDRAFEVVEVNLGASLREGHAERDKDGIPRVVEAAEATPWSNLSRKSLNSNGSINANKSAIDSSGSLAATAGFAAPLPTPPASGAGSDAAQVAAWHASCKIPAAAGGSLPEEEKHPLGSASPQNESGGSTNDFEAVLFPRGTEVVVVGLTGASHHNGSVGTVLRYDSPQKRFAVRLAPDPRAQRRAELGWEEPASPSAKLPVLAVRAANLQVHNPQASAAMAASAASVGSVSTSTGATGSDDSGTSDATTAEAATDALTAQLKDSNGLSERDLGALEEVNYSSFCTKKVNKSVRIHLSFILPSIRYFLRL